MFTRFSEQTFWLFFYTVFRILVEKVVLQVYSIASQWTLFAHAVSADHKNGSKLQG